MKKWESVFSWIARGRGAICALGGVVLILREGYELLRPLLRSRQLSPGLCLEHCVIPRR